MDGVAGESKRPNTVKSESPEAEFRVRARFYAIRQVDGESTSDWYGRVRVAAIPCRFGSRRRIDAAVADKFVTGLRPGPAADRLLEERADGRPPDDLLAVAVNAEKDAARLQCAAVRPSSVPPKCNVLSAAAVAAPPAALDALAEIRETLKLYRYSGDRYSGDRYTAAVAGLSAGADENSQNSLKSNEKSLTSNMQSTHEESSWWRNKIEKTTKYENVVKNYTPLTCTLCCSLATKLLDNFDEKTLLFHQPDPNETPNKFSSQNFENCRDNSNCYCLSLVNNECKKKNEIRTTKNDDYYQTTKCFDVTKKKTECYICQNENLINL